MVAYKLPPWWCWGECQGGAGVVLRVVPGWCWGWCWGWCRGGAGGGAGVVLGVMQLSLSPKTTPNHRNRPFPAQYALFRRRFEPAPSTIICHQPLRARNVPIRLQRRHNRSPVPSNFLSSANYADIHLNSLPLLKIDAAMPPQYIHDRRISFSSTLSHISNRFPPTTRGHCPFWSITS